MDNPKLTPRKTNAMNKELEGWLKIYFLQWEKRMDEIEDKFLTGQITYSEYISSQLENQRDAATKMFDTIHSHCNWNRK